MLLHDCTVSPNLHFNLIHIYHTHILYTTKHCPAFTAQSFITLHTGGRVGNNHIRIQKDGGRFLYVC